MRVGTFLTAIQQSVEREKVPPLTREAVKRAAQKIIDKELTAPPKLSVRVNCTGSGVKLLKLSAKLLPEHPYYCEWLKPKTQSVSCTFAVYSFIKGNNSLKITPSGNVQINSELDEIISSLESKAKEETVKQTELLRSLCLFEQKNQITGDALYQLYATVSELQRCSSVSLKELLNASTMVSYLEKWADTHDS